MTINNMISPLEVSTGYLEQEIKVAGKALQRLQKHKEQQDDLGPSHGSKTAQLSKLRGMAESLAFAQEMAKWRAQCPPQSVDQSYESLIILQAEWCNQLASILMDHPDDQVYGEVFLPLYKFVIPTLLALLRNELEGQKPEILIRQCQKSPETSAFAQSCRWSLLLQHSSRSLDNVLEHVVPQTIPEMTLARELLRPSIRRVIFHFVEESSERITTTRVDRLPEWLLQYIFDNIIDGIQGLIGSGLGSVLENTSQLNVCFWQELVGMVVWVLSERNFFRHPDIAGPRSNPAHLYNAMEQFILFDRSLRESVGQEIYGLMDTLVFCDDELRQWFIDREREVVFANLFEDESTTNVPKPLANHVSPKAEIFCALIRSVQWKASVLVEPGIYVRDVAVRLCSQFVDALQEAATDLRNFMREPSLDLKANLNEWIEIINGTKLAALVLSKQGTWQDGMPVSSQSDHDLARFGRSLERLVEVMVDELASTFVETILMERAKLASYLMMASHLLASRKWDGDDLDLSAEAKEARAALEVLHQVCRSITTFVEEGEEYTSFERQTAIFAPNAIQEHVMNKVAEKLLEVVLDSDDVAPDLWVDGSAIFCRDVDVLVGGDFAYLPSVQRLLGITKLLTTQSGPGLRSAIGGLVGSSTILEIEDFSGDEKIFNEAVMMLQVKGFVHLELKDALSILSRRRD